MMRSPGPPGASVQVNRVGTRWWSLNVRPLAGLRILADGGSSRGACVVVGRSLELGVAERGEAV